MLSYVRKVWSSMLFNVKKGVEFNAVLCQKGVEFNVGEGLEFTVVLGKEGLDFNAFLCKKGVKFNVGQCQKEWSSMLLNVSKE